MAPNNFCMLLWDRCQPLRVAPKDLHGHYYVLSPCLRHWEWQTAGRTNTLCAKATFLARTPWKWQPPPDVSDVFQAWVRCNIALDGRFAFDPVIFAFWPRNKDKGRKPKKRNKSTYRRQQLCGSTGPQCERACGLDLLLVAPSY